MADAFLSTFTFETQLSDASINKLATQVQEAVRRGLGRVSDQLKNNKDTFEHNIGSDMGRAAQNSDIDSNKKWFEKLIAKGAAEKTGSGGGQPLMDAMSTSLGGIFKYTKLISVYVLAISLLFALVGKFIEKLEARFKETKDFLLKGGMIERGGTGWNIGKGSYGMAKGAISDVLDISRGLYNREDIKKVIDKDLVGFASMTKQLDVLGHSFDTNKGIMKEYLHVMSLSIKANEENIDSIMSLTSTIVRRFGYMGDSLKGHVEQFGKYYEMMFRGLDRQQANELDEAIKRQNLFMALQGETMTQMELRTKQTTSMLSSLKAIGFGDLGASLISEISKGQWNQDALSVAIKDQITEFRNMTTNADMSDSEIGQKSIEMIKQIGEQVSHYTDDSGQLAGRSFEAFLESSKMSRDLAEKAFMAYKQLSNLNPAELEERISEFKAQQNLEDILKRTTDPTERLINVMSRIMDGIVTKVEPAMNMLMRWLAMIDQGEVHVDPDEQAKQFASGQLAKSEHLSTLNEMKKMATQVNDKDKQAMYKKIAEYSEKFNGELAHEREDWEKSLLASADSLSFDGETNKQLYISKAYADVVGMVDAIKAGEIQASIAKATSDSAHVTTKKWWQSPLGNLANLFLPSDEKTAADLVAARSGNSVVPGTPVPLGSQSSAPDPMFQATKDQIEQTKKLNAYLGQLGVDWTKDLAAKHDAMVKVQTTSNGTPFTSSASAGGTNSSVSSVITFKK